MFYREAGDFKTSYAEDNQTFPIAFDRYRYYFVLIVGLAIVPFVINDYWANAILLPFLIYAIAAIGLNILTGYCGQVSLGTGGFMAVGAYTSYKLMTAFPWMDMVTITLLSGVMTAIVGVMFGLPACASRASTWPWRRWRRSSSSSGSSTRCRGSTTTRPRGRSTRRNGSCSGRP
jgi:branched-chain amino acid transport system permease protein